MRYRPSAGRIIVELFYGEGEHLERTPSGIHIKISQLARKLHVRPCRLRDSLEWMFKYDILQMLRWERRDAVVKLRQPAWTRKEIWDGRQRD